MQTHAITRKVPVNSTPSYILNQRTEKEYTQTFQCQCQKFFKTIHEYQHHIHSNPHDNVYLSHPISEQIDRADGQNLAQEVSQHNQNQNIDFNRISENRQHGELSQYNIQFEERAENQNSSSSDSNQINENQPNQPTQNQPSSYISQQRFPIHSSIPPEQKLFNFRYVQAYYEQKMMRFYRQFDIEPYKSHTTVRKNSYYVQQLQKIYKKSPVQPQNSVKNVKDNAQRDQRKIAQEYDSKMIPIQNGIISFVENFIKEDMKQIVEITVEKMEIIHQVFREKTTILQQLTWMIDKKTMKEAPNHQEDFIETDLFTALFYFVGFVRPNLRYYELLIVQNIAIIVMDTVIEYYTLHQEYLDKNLKVCDLPYLYSQIQINAESKNYELPFQINSLTINQFLTLFNQYCSILQYINNKNRVDYLEPLMQQINQINEVYRQNVLNYQRSSKKRRTAFLKKMKRKMIEKKMKLERTIHDPRDFRQTFASFGINLNPNIQYNGKYYEMNKNPDNKNGPVRGNTMNSLPFNQKSQKNHLQNQPNQTANEPKSSRSLNQNHEQRSSANQRAIGRSSSMQSRHKKNNQNPDESGEESSEMNHNYEPKVCEYEDYFSPEKEEERNKQEEEWKVKSEYFNQILTDSVIFKSKLTEEVFKQLKEVEQLYFQLGIRSSTSKMIKKINKIVEKYPLHLISTIPTNQEPSLPSQQVSSEKLQFSAKLQPNIKLEQTKKTNKDPFSIIKNYRLKSLHEKKAQEIFNKNDFLILPQQSLQEDAQNQLSPNQDDPFDALL